MKKYILIAIVIIFSSCNKIEHSDNLDEKHKTELKLFLEQNKYKVINYNDLSLIDSTDYSIGDILKTESGSDGFWELFLDSLYEKLDEIDIDNLSASNSELSEIQIFRLFKGTFAFGLNDFTVLTLVKNDDTITFHEHYLKYSKECNLPFDESDEKKKRLSSNCFEIIKERKISCNIDDWKSVYAVFVKSELYNTVYFEASRKLCDGFTFKLDFLVKYSGSNTYERNYKLSCPGELTGIYLMYSELLKLSGAK